MSDFALTEAVINFAAGTEVNWNAFQLPIPANMVVYTIDTKKFKRGDGYRKYSELPAGPSIAGILSGDVSASQLLEQLVPGDDDSIIVVDNQKYVASETKLSTLISRLTAIASVDATQSADLTTIGSQFGLANTNITVADNNKLAITNNSKMTVGPTQESFISLSPIPVIAIKDVTFYSDTKCMNKVNNIYANRTYYAKIECIHDSADTDNITFALTDNSALTTITTIGRGVYKVVISSTNVDASAVFTATATYNADTTTITKTVTIGKDRSIIFNVFSGTGADYYGRVAIDSSGNLFTVGQTDSEGSGGTECMVIKFDSNLNILARKRLGSVNNDWFGGVNVDSNGNVYCVGSTYAAGVGNNDGIIAKYDNSLNLLVQKTFGGVGAEQISDIVIDASGNMYCTGISTTETPGIEDAIVVKLDSNFNVLAQKRYGGAGHDAFQRMAVDSTGNIYCVGRTSSEGTGNNDALIVKFDSSLNILARKRYGGTADDFFYSVAVDSSNNVICVGSERSTADGQPANALVVKFDSSLNILAKKRFGGLQSDVFYDVDIDSGGNIFCVGNTASEGTNVSATIVEFDTNLNVIAKKYFGGIGSDGFGGIVINSSDSIYCFGNVSGITSDAVAVRFPNNLPSGTYEIISDLGIYLNDSFLPVNDVTLTLANSTLTLTNSSLTLTTSSLTAANALLTWSLGTVQY